MPIARAPGSCRQAESRGTPGRPGRTTMLDLLGNHASICVAEFMSVDLEEKGPGPEGCIDDDAASPASRRDRRMREGFNVCLGTVVFRIKRSETGGRIPTYGRIPLNTPTSLRKRSQGFTTRAPRSESDHSLGRFRDRHHMKRQRNGSHETVKCTRTVQHGMDCTIWHGDGMCDSIECYVAYR